ncbi:hypothetical protein JXO59_02260, partial [candidate division KSB1 bacterium]|nr:hypothetical protein [candidate division KSB1 bacterium]
QYFKPSGFLAKFAKISVQVDDREITAGVGSSKKIAVSGSPQVWYNRVEGLHAGLIGSIKISQLTLLPKVAYLTAAKDWATGMECSYAIGKSRWANLSLHYHDAVLPVTEPSLYPQLITSIPVLLAERDYYDYYRSKSAAARLTLRSAEHHLRATIGLSREKHSSLEKHTDFDLLGENAPQRRNPAIADGVLSSARLQLIWGETVMTGVVGGTGLQVRAEGGFKGLWGGEFEYARYNVILNGRLRTFLRRRLISPCLDVRLLAGGHTGELPPQRLMAMDGFLSVYSPFGGFRTLRNRPVYSGNYAALFWEHSFRTWPFEITGLKFLTKQGYNLILHGAHGKSWDDAQDHPGWPVGFATKQQQHHEIGLSLSGLLSYFRLDVTKSLSGNHDLYWGIGLAKIF